MSEPIKAGDLVVVVKPRLCCGDTSGLGRVFVVYDVHQGSYCQSCRTRYEGMVAGIGLFVSCELTRLKRIDPLPESENEKRDEEITA